MMDLPSRLAAIQLGALALCLTICGSVVTAAEDASRSAPQVALSDGHQRLCLKNVGDSIGKWQLPDINNKQQTAADQLSERLTVLVFWDARSAISREQFQRIPVDVLADFAARRVKVIAIHSGGSVDETRRQTGDAADKILSLADPKRTVFSQFSTQPGPRTYIVDGRGKILWLDIEYSQGMLYNLRQALEFYLRQE